MLAGPVTASDDLSTDEACPDVSTVGDLDAFLESGESIDRDMLAAHQAAKRELERKRKDLEARRKDPNANVRKKVRYNMYDGRFGRVVRLEGGGPAVEKKFATGFGALPVRTPQGSEWHRPTTGWQEPTLDEARTELRGQLDRSIVEWLQKELRRELTRALDERAKNPALNVDTGVLRYFLGRREITWAREHLPMLPPTEAAEAGATPAPAK